MKKFIEFINYWGQLLLLPIYWLSFFIPRNKNIWLFGSTFGKRFSDNPKYFYLYLSQHKQLGIKPVWISHNEQLVGELRQAGYSAYRNLSIQGIWYCLRGKVYLYDNYSKDISFALSGGAVKINLWHGIPLKKIQMDNLFDEVRHPNTIWKKFRYIPRRMTDEKATHYILAPSPFFAPIFSSAFCTKRVIVCGYPRCDSFTCNKIAPFLLKREQQHLSILKKKQAYKTLLYMPTFRESERKFFDVVDLNILSDFLEEHNYFLCIKLHPKSKLQLQFKQIESNNILLLDADTDPYIFIPYSDGLITDYSSIYFDYLLTYKPILFFCYDLAEYIEQSRKLYFSYEKATPGKKVKNLQELMDALGDWKLLEQDTEKNRDKIIDKAFGKNKNIVSSYLLCQKIKKVISSTTYV